MKITGNWKDRQRLQEGYALMVVFFFVAIGLAAVAGAIQWTATTVLLNERSNSYFKTLAAAEAATEKVVSAISRDYQLKGEAAVFSSMEDYRAMIPSGAESDYWADYEFSDGQGSSGRTYVSRSSAWGYTELMSQYKGLRGMAATYQIVSNARPQGQGPAVGLMQEVQVASIPVFQFAIFYSIDLEINPGATMRVTGRVHSNGNIYTQPDGVQLTFENHVTSAKDLVTGKKPGDPSSRSTGTIVFQGEHDGGVSSLNLPIGTNNTPEAVHAVLEVPSIWEDRNSPMGKQRYYNRTDLVILVTDDGVTAKSGAFDDFLTTLTVSEVNTFLKTDRTFYNKREGKTICATEIDVAKLKQWNATNTSLRPLVGGDVSSVYVADLRSQTGSTQSGVRLVNGQTLPPSGLTVATPNPLYVKGHYNAPAGALGTTNTTGTLPASLVADAITVLSTAWDDSKSFSSLSERVAADTTVNAAFLAGIVETANGSYSGGVENFPRFLENWSGKTLTYNGSMVVMFPSQIATAPWGGSDVYSPPRRNWAFDLNFMDSTKLPPCTPQVSTLIRGAWKVVAAGDGT